MKTATSIQPVAESLNTVGRHYCHEGHKGTATRYYYEIGDIYGTYSSNNEGVAYPTFDAAADAGMKEINALNLNATLFVYHF